MSLYQFDAYEAYRNLKDRYAEYLLDSFRIDRGPLARMLLAQWRSEDPAAAALLAPLLVQAAFPFAPGRTARDLTTRDPKKPDPERPLHPKTLALLEKAGFNDPFYAHQVAAIRAGCAGKTVVLSAGTGSGKTEAFLVPLIDRLHWAEERGEDDLSQPGVRAIIVYPLNALVNNQVDRVRKLLSLQERITFAYYTSRLKETYNQGLRAITDKGGKKPPTCQIIDRRSLRGTDPDGRVPSGPPHILITNFSMLEYMLIRAVDRPIFQHANLFTAEGRARLQAIVLDEAHVYGGAQAAEIHLLLRRAAQRFGTKLEDLQGYATSATLSRSSDDEQEVLARFAEGMFRTPPGRLVPLVGRRHLPDETGAVRSSTLTDPVKLPEGPLVAPALRTLEFDAEGSPIAFVVDPALGALAAEAVVTLGLATSAEVAALAPDVRACPALLLHELLSTHGRVIDLRSWFHDRSDRELPSLDEVAAFLYGAGEASEARRRATDAVLRLGSLARWEPKSLPLVPTRMHAMLRAPGGVWVDPRPGGEREGAGEAPWPWGAVGPRAPAEGEPARFPLCVCTTCGATALEAWEGKDEWGEVQLSPRSQGHASPVALFHDAASDGRLPVALGGLPVRSVAQRRRRRGGQSTIECPRCGDPDAVLRTLALSPRAALGAIVDAIYPYLNEHAGEGNKPGGGRRILSFSDSRQEAARVAVEVEESHDVGLNRRMLWEAVRRHEGPVEIKDLIEDLVVDPMLRQRAPACDLPDALLEELAMIAVYKEFARIPARGNTLETLGLVEVVYPKLPARPAELTALDDATWRLFLSAVLDDARRRGVVRSPPLSTEAKENHQLDDLLPPKIDKRLAWMTSVPGEDGEEGYEVVPLLPAIRERGRLFGFASAVAQKCGGLDPVALLEHAWKALLTLARTPTCRWLNAEVSEDALRLDLRRLALRAHESPPYIQEAARRVCFRHVLGCVPERGTPGTVRPLTDEERDAWRARHAIRRILDDQPLALWSVEHTAQLDTDELEEQEAKFRAGQRNLMASSTTMEMGVDLGGLTFVLMTNVPPAPSNYWQRAGRAGRRADGSAMALTLALGRPHDQKVFGDLKGFLLGKVVPPAVRLDTPPLVLRHANALLLATFLDRVVEPTRSGAPMRVFGTVAEVLFEEAQVKPGFKKAVADQLGLDPKETLATAYVRWLEQLHEGDPVALDLQQLLEGTPLEVWTIGEIAAQSSARFEQAAALALQDREAIEEQRRAEKARGEGVADSKYLTALEFQEKDIANETLIAYLARNDYLPRFGFPINLVRLETKWTKTKGRDDDDRSGVPELRMERALDIALSEYAPGAEVIAGKRVHQVAGVLRNWMSDDSGMVRRRVFFECRKCGAVQDRATTPSRCPVCNHPTVAEEKFLAEASKEARKPKGKVEEAAPLAGDLGPSPLRQYLMPSSFSVQYGRRPRRLGGDLERMPPARVVLVTSADSAVIDVLPGAVAVGFAPESRLFVRSEGDRPFPSAPFGWGYAICQSCGRAEPEEGWKGSEGKELPKALQKHWRLRGGECKAKSYWRKSVLGTSGTVDVFRLRLLGDFIPKLQPGDEETFYMTLAICLHQVVCEKLQVDPRALKPTVGTWHVNAAGETPEMFGREAVIYDESGSGMLAHVAADGGAIVKEIIDFVASRTDLDLIAFDTQFVAMEGKLRLDLVRAHLLDPARRARIEAPAVYEQMGGIPLRGVSIRSATRALLVDGRAEVALWASAIAADAFERDAILRAAHLRAVRGGGQPVRLLLGSAPRPSGGTVDEAFVAGRLRLLLAEGVEVRTAPGGFGKLGQSPWQVLSQDLHGPRALGGAVTQDGGKRVVAPGGPSFGRTWLDGAMSLEAKPDAAKAAWAAFEETWAKGRKLVAEELEAKPVSGVEFVPIKQGATDDRSTIPQVLLASKLGDLKKLGRVTRLVYVDRYVVRSAVAMWRLGDLLRRFDYAKDARGFVLALPAEERGDSRPADELLKDTRVPSNLGRREAENMAEWCCKYVASVGLTLGFQQRGHDKGIHMRHPRKLLLQFEPGGALRTLKVLFEHGLDWAPPVPGKGLWVQRPLRAEETHVVMLRDHQLEDELDERGKSEWGTLFG